MACPLTPDTTTTESGEEESDAGYTLKDIIMKVYVWVDHGFTVYYASIPPLTLVIGVCG